MIFRNCLPGVHSFLRPARLAPSAASFVCRLMLAFLCHLGRMTAAQAAGLPKAASRHRASAGRFLGRPRWAAGDWLAPLRAAVLRRQAPGGLFFFLLDQTCASRQGHKTQNTFSTGNRTRRPRRGRRYDGKKHARKRCHAFVCGLLLCPDGARVPYRRSYYTAEYGRQRGLAHKTQAEPGAELIAALDVPAGARVVVLGDTAYEARVVQQACAARGFSWITPCNAERVLAGPAPRPKARALLQASPSWRFVPIKARPAADPYAAYRRGPARRGRGGQGRTYRVWRQRLLPQSVGPVWVFVSTTRRPEPGQPLHEPKVLLSSAELTAREVVWRYTLRWQVELFFKEAKGTLGLTSYRFGDFTRVGRWVDVGLACYLYLEWYRQVQLARDGPGAAAAARSRGPQRTGGLARAVRCAREEQELIWLRQRLSTPAGARRLRRLVRAALPPAARAG